jgi:hypothetical protein
MKADGHFGRYCLKGAATDAAKVILNAVSCNFRLKDFGPTTDQDRPVLNSAS